MKSWKKLGSVVALMTLAVCSGCGGGDTTDVTSAKVVATQGDDGWQLGILGVNAGDVQALSIDGVDYMPSLRRMADGGTGYFFDASDDEGKAFFFGSMRHPADDGLPLTGQVTVATAEGDFSVPMAFTTGQGTTAADVDAQARSTAMGINWSAIWATAKKMAARGTANAAIKAYMRSKGYYCPIGPWFLCARPVS